MFTLKVLGSMQLPFSSIKPWWRRPRRTAVACTAVAFAMLLIADARAQGGGNTLTVQSLTVAGGQAAPGDDSIKKLVFDAGGSTALLDVSAGAGPDAFITTQVRLESDLVITNALTGYTLTFEDTLQGGNESARHDVTVQGAGHVTFAQNIANVDAFTHAGSGTLTFGGTTTLGSLTLTGGLIELSTSHLTVDTLTITGDTILDFGTHGESFLAAGLISIADGATLTIRNWTEAADYFQAMLEPTASTLAAVTFEGYESGSAWTAYGSQIQPFQPVPEPATYGAFFVGAAVGVVWLRRRHAQ